MAATKAQQRLDTRNARKRLPQSRNREPYWRLVERGAYLGYYKGSTAGTWMARYRPKGGKYIKRTLGTADDVTEADGHAVLSFEQAQEAARAFFDEQRKAEHGIEEPAGPYTVRDAIEDYLADYKHRGGKAVHDARTRAEAWILPELGDVEVAKLTAARIKAWQRSVAESPARVRTAAGAAPRTRPQSDDPDAARARRATANRMLATLKAALNLAWQEGKVSSDDAWRRVRPFKQANSARVRYLDSGEVTRLVNACPEDLRDLVRGALFTGARYGELVALEVADFNKDAGTIAVRQSKSGKPRHVVLTDDGRRFFEHLTAGRTGAEALFLKADGTAWGSGHQRRPLQAACKRARISPAVSFHILRHTYASSLAKNGVPMAVISANLGHSTTRMVETHYAHLAPSYVADTIRSAGLGYEVPRDSTNVARLG